MLHASKHNQERKNSHDHILRMTFPNNSMLALIRKRDSAPDRNLFNVCVFPILFRFSSGLFPFERHSLYTVCIDWPWNSLSIPSAKLRDKNCASFIFLSALSPPFYSRLCWNGLLFVTIARLKFVCCNPSIEYNLMCQTELHANPSMSCTVWLLLFGLRVCYTHLIIRHFCSYIA